MPLQIRDTTGSTFVLDRIDGDKRRNVVIKITGTPVLAQLLDHARSRHLLAGRIGQGYTDITTVTMANLLQVYQSDEKSMTPTGKLELRLLAESLYDVISFKSHRADGALRHGDSFRLFVGDLTPGLEPSWEGIIEEITRT